jgi:hypothetical protein
MGKLTPPRLNVGELCLRELCAGDGLSPEHKAAFDAAYAAIQELRGVAITARPEDHQPVCPAPGVVGCSCGMTPKRSARMSQMGTPYLSHIGRLGLPSPRYVDPLVTYGDDAGKKWSEIYHHA